MKKFIALLLLLATVSCAAAKDITDKQGTLKRTLRSLVAVTHPAEDDKTYICTGAVIDSARGWILTAAHCLGDDLEVNDIPAQVVTTDGELAIVKVPVLLGPPIKIAKDVDLLDEVEAIGYGLGHLTVLDRRISAIINNEVELDGTAVPGMSGGPIVNADGELVGIMQRGDGVSFISGPDYVRNFVQAAQK